MLHFIHSFMGDVICENASKQNWDTVSIHAAVPSSLLPRTQGNFLRSRYRVKCYLRFVEENRDLLCKLIIQLLGMYFKINSS